MTLARSDSRSAEAPPDRFESFDINSSGTDRLAPGGLSGLLTGFRSGPDIPEPVPFPDRAPGCSSPLPHGNSAADYLGLPFGHERVVRNVPPRPFQLGYRFVIFLCLNVFMIFKVLYQFNQLLRVICSTTIPRDIKLHSHRVFFERRRAEPLLRVQSFSLPTIATKVIFPG